MAQPILALIIVFSVIAAMLYLASKGREVKLTRDELSELIRTCPKIVVKISGGIRREKLGNGKDRGRSKGDNIL